MATVAFATLGCKLNTAESHALSEVFAAHAYDVVPFESPADVFVVNSCTVTARSDHKSRQLLRRILRRAPGARVVVTGCYAERDARALAAIPGVHLVVGNGAKLSIPRLLEVEPAGAVVLDAAGAEQGGFAEAPLSGFGSYNRAFLKIQDGCDYHCAFCIVTAVRGASRSLPAATALEHARSLAAAGFREICLTGVDPGAWGRDLPGRPTLGRLIEELVALEGLERIRLSSVGAQDYDDHLIDLVGAHPKLARHVHIPLQSGSDSLLKRMRRGARRAEIDRLVERLLAIDASLRFGGDFMVGFPGEDAADFEATRALLEDGPWSYGHVFPFSPRPGTAAASMADQVPDRERHRRAKILRIIAAAKDLAYRKTLVGTRASVLIENLEEPRRGYAQGLSSHYVRVSFPRMQTRAGEIAEIDITAADASRTLGSLVA